MIRSLFAVPRPSTLRLAVMGLIGCGSLSAEETKPLSFNLDIRPILAENCFHCHGQDAAERKADLRLDTALGAHADLGGYAAVVPGNPENSELYLRVTSTDPEESMPPPDSNRSLTDAQRETLRQWIKQGGEYDTHWAFVPPVKATPPALSENPIDAFIAETLAEKGLAFSPESEPEIWLRRASLDLIGLPPTLEELEAFAKDLAAHGESAYVRQVDRLLASPHFGERMAADWMDAARYADTHGFNNDSSRNMWRWRDWVIDAFNQNMPYDQFITEQLAGDLLPDPTLEQRIATGFNRNHGINSEGGIIEEEYRVEYVADRVRTVGMVWMGLTTECARCHDHKYDPFTQEDYYRLFAFFNNVGELGEDGRVANAVPMIPAPTESQSERLQTLESRYEDLDRRMTKHLAGVTLAEQHIELARARLDELAEDLPKPVWSFNSPEQTDEKLFESLSEEATQPGILGSALASQQGKRAGQIKADNLAYEEETQAFTIAFWFRPDPSNPREAPLLSNAEFENKPSSSGYGSGWDIRLIDGEIEIAFAKRYPAYAVIMRTRSADIRPEEWRHVTVSFVGRTAEDTEYTPASRFRIYLDGEEVRTSVRHDGLQNFPGKGGRPLAIGFDSFPDSKEFAGRIDEIQQFSQALDDATIARLFERDALKSILARTSSSNSVDAHGLTSRERHWITRSALDRESDPQWIALRQERKRASQKLLELEREIPTTMVMEENPGMRQAYILQRGHYEARGAPVDAGVPEDWIAPWPEGAPRNRLGLAEWLTQPSQPLTARVVVNRFWQQLFGIGLVKTSEDFGVQSEYPSHPELLDWLAVDFRESGWDVKRLIKQIVLSQTYRQDSKTPRELLQADPENRLLARGPRFRLPAETVRDQALALSGLLDRRIGGPSVHPYQPEGFYNNMVVGANYPSTVWTQSEGNDLYRRSLYTFWKRTVPHPLMTTFDAPDREVCTVRRSRTNTPLQALALMNGPTFVEASRALAEAVLSEGETDPANRLQRAFQMATGRSPDSQESIALRQALDDMLASYDAHPSEADALLSVGESDVSTNHSPQELAAYTAVMSLILNLDETLSKG